MRFFIICCFLSLQTLVFAQKTSAVADTLPFPAAWSGVWSGQLEIFSPTGLAQTIEMSLEIAPIDTSTTGRYTWGMVYVSKQKDWRPYELVPIAPEKGLWQVDEKNGIRMESYLFGQKLLCWFVVQGSRVLCTYEKTGPNSMVFEVMAGKETPASSTGNTQNAGEDIPEVKTYPFSGFQRAILTRKK